MRVSASGGIAKPEVAKEDLEGVNSLGWPEFLPDGKQFIYLAGTIDNESRVMVQSLDSKKARVLLNSDSRVQYVEPGYLVYVLNGRGRFGLERRPAGSGQLVTYGPGDSVTIAAEDRQETRSPDHDVLILGGRPIGEPVAWDGPFVMNTKAEIARAFEDFQAGRLGTIPAERIDRPRG